MLTQLRFFIGMVWLVVSLALMIYDQSESLYKALFALSIFFNADMLHRQSSIPQTDRQPQSTEPANWREAV